MTKTIFTPDQFDNLIAMGKSPDIENQILALQLIETVNFDEHLIYIMLLYKLGKIEPETWYIHGSKTYKQLKRKWSYAGLTMASVITYKRIFAMLGTVKKNKEEQIQFFLRYFGSYLEKQCKALGYDFIETLEIKINSKNETESGIVSKSI